MEAAIRSFLKRSVLAHPDPLDWWAYILNITKGHFEVLLEGYEGDMFQMHKTIRGD